MEKRRANRYRLEVDFCIMTHGSVHFLSILRNVSRFGMKLELSFDRNRDLLVEGQRVFLEAMPENFKDIMTKKTGTIVWVSNMEVGIGFDEPLTVTPEELGVIMSEVEASVSSGRVDTAASE